MRTLTLAVLLLAACKSPRNTYKEDDTARYTGAEGASPKVWVMWIKHRETTLHVGVKIQNDSAHAITVKDGDIWLDFEGTRGTQTKAFAPMSIPAGESKSFGRIFAFGALLAKEGTATVTVSLGRDGRAAFELPVKPIVSRPSTSP